ncbi:conserved hypothetical protein [Candidatus Desulfarcum epimagneticum]|uniref:DUF3782 domain-containing protein n=1 Tax=uncultured Desulfobacteraceae bacterium TaxID=218296 RepID=A0A484HLM1_9BACT|nr:conserved hypothetical protein [uncultured Desulfobacteraceae bacterium]
MNQDFTREQIKTMIIAELPSIIKTDPEVRDFVVKVTESRYAGRKKTKDRIDRILDELKRDREKRDKKWDAQEKKWEAQEKKWEAQDKRWEEENKKQAEKWAAQDKRWEEENKKQAEKWAAWEKKWEEERKKQDEKWEKNQEAIDRMLDSIEALNKKHDATIGALGARWGLQSEGAFRKGLRSILEKSFGVKVERYWDFDTDGVVFGRPDQIEMDVIIHNGTLILCEIKSSASKSQVYTFWKKKRFYEKKHGRKADRALIISPMVDKKAGETAEKLGIEVFGYVQDVTWDE